MNNKEYLASILCGVTSAFFYYLDGQAFLAYLLGVLVWQIDIIIDIMRGKK